VYTETYSEGPRDAELHALAAMLDLEADRWRRRGLWGLADRLEMAAECAAGWVGIDRMSDDR
jgi:hypothetical protein